MSATLTKPRADEKIRKAVIAEMEARGMTTRDLAKCEGLLESSVARFLSGHGVNSNTLASILAALDLEVV